MDWNVYDATTSSSLTFPLGVNWTQWQATGQDEHSVIADPMFSDPAHGNFTLRPSSPALALGFKEMDTGAGPRSCPDGLVRCT